MSGLPDIGTSGAQVGYSRLAWARLEGCFSKTMVRDALLRNAPHHEVFNTYCVFSNPRILRASSDVATSRPSPRAMPTMRSTSTALFLANSPGAM